MIKGGRIIDEPKEFIAADFYDEWMRRGLPQEHDVLITTEAPLGEVAVLRGSERVALAQRVILLRARAGTMDPYFLFYALQSDFGQGELKARSSGTTVSGIKQSELRQVRLPRFPLQTQRRIATILSAYDDLIENNLRRIKILEEMARIVYREWFVELHFPGAVASKAALPHGWELCRLGDYLTALEAGTRPKGGIRDEVDGVPSIGAENIDGIGRHKFEAEKFVSREFFQQMRRGIVRDRDVAIYKDGAYIGKSSYFRDGFPHAECCVNEHVFLVRTDGVRLMPNAFYLWLQEPDTLHAIRATNANAAQPGINQQCPSGKRA